MRIGTSLFRKIYNWMNGNNMKLKSEVEKLNSRLLELFELEEGFVVALNGEWGIGKTHYWHNFVRKYLAEKDVAYVTLFGKVTIKDIQSSIVLQISKRAKVYDYLNDKIGSSKVFGIDISSVLSIMDKSDFENTIICIDDFERLSDKLTDKDILGLISELKERKNCKIIMIYNQDEIEDPTIISRYKDKIIDYELHYKPTVAESYSTISNKLKVLQTYPLEYFESRRINNIRVMKRVVSTLNDFAFVEEYTKGYDFLKEEIAHSIIRFAALNAKFHSYDYDALVRYSKKKLYSSENKPLEVNEEYEEMLFLLSIERYFYADEISNILNEYNKSSIIYKEKLLQVIEDRKAQANRKEIVTAIKEIQSKFDYDLHYTNESYVGDMFVLLEKYSDNIVEIIGDDSFVYYIGLLSELDQNKSPQYKNFGVDCLKHYLDKHFEQIRHERFRHFDRLGKIIEFDTRLDEYVKTLENTLKSTQISTKENLLKFMQNPKRNRTWGSELDLLALVDNKTYEKFILEDPTFFREVMSFISWAQGFGGESEYKNAMETMVNVMKDMEKTGDETIRFKMKRTLEYLKIDREESL